MYAKKKLFENLKQDLKKLVPSAHTQQLAGSSELPPPTKKIPRITESFTQKLMERLPKIADGDAVEIASHIAKAVIETKKAVEDKSNSLDLHEQRIAYIGAQLEIVEAPSTGGPIDAEAEKFRVYFEKTLQKGLTELKQISSDGFVHQIVEHEAKEWKIAKIFSRFNEARVQFELAIGIRVFESVYTIDQSLKERLLQWLQASLIADHKHQLESKEKELLYRVVTPGTHVRLLENISRWARTKYTSSGGPSVYWLFGPAGTGKSTIAYTIARRFEFTGKHDDPIILGANFLCSRQFEETRESKRIIRTIVYHLALACEPFADALTRFWKFEAFDFDVQTQIENLLVKPWQESESARNKASTQLYLVVIDALDEIVGQDGGKQDGSEFLRDLFDAINRSQLRGLKFFVTSTPDPELVTHVKSFKKKLQKFYLLQDVAELDDQADTEELGPIWNDWKWVQRLRMSANRK